MKRYKIAFTPEAEDDMREVYLFTTGYANDKRGKEVMRELKESILSLRTMPLRYGIPQYPICEQLALRRMLVGNYSVFYQVDEDTAAVTVVNIIWSRADLQAKLGFSRK